MKLSKWFVAAALALPMIATTARADEKNEQSTTGTKVTMSDLPSAVKTTVQRESKGKTIEHMTKDEQNGKTVYNVEVVSNGKGQDLVISDTGKVLDRKAPHDEKNENEPEHK